MTTEFGHYRLVRPLGRGGEGSVWIASDSKVGREVALKLFHSADARTSRMLDAEIRRSAGLDHPGICPILDCGIDGGAAWLAMPLIPSLPLREYLDRSPLGAGQLSASLPGRRDGEDGTSRVLRLIEGVARALSHAHERGVSHGDVTPGNILVRSDGEPVLIDFVVSEDRTAGATTGTPAYLAPEVLAGAVPDDRSDIHALGVILFESLEGNRPVLASGAAPWSHSGRRRARDSRFLLGTRRPRDLVAVLGCALREDPGHRYTAAATFADDLAALRAGRPVSVRKDSFVAAAWRRARQEPVSALILLLLLLGLPGLAAVAGRAIARWPEASRGVQLAAQARHDRFLDEGFERLIQEDAGGALAAFREAQGIRDSDEAVAGLFLAHRRRGDAQAMLNELDRGWKASRHSLAYAVMAADALHRLGRDEEATALRASAPSASSPLDHLLPLYLDRGASQDLLRSTSGLASARRSVLLAGPARRLTWLILGQAAAAKGDRVLAGEVGNEIRRRWPYDELMLRAALSCLDVAGDPATREIAVMVLGWPDPAPSTLVACGRALLGRTRIRTPERDLGLAAEVIDRLRNRDAPVLPETAIPWLESRLAFLRGQEDAAFQAAEKLAEEESSDPALLIELASWHLGARRPADALRLVGKVPPAYPDRARLNFTMAAAHEQMGSAEALRFAEETVRAWPSASGPRAILGRCLWRAGRRDEALSALAVSIALDPEAQASYRELGYGLLGLRRAQESVPWLAKARELGPDDPTNITNLARALSESGDRAGAAELLKDRPGKESWHVNLLATVGGLLLETLDAHEEAVTVLGRLLEKRPSDPSVLLLMARAKLKGGREEEALALLQRAIASSPGLVQAHELLATVAQRLGNRTLEAQALSKVVSARPRIASLQVRLGSALEALGDLTGAAKALRESVRIDPECAEGWCNLGLRLEQDGNLQEAVRCLTRGHAIGKRRADWPYPSAEWLRRCRQRLSQGSPPP